MKSVPPLVVATLACFASLSAQAAAFTNGSFELHDSTIESTTSEPLVMAGQHLLPGWDVLAGSINYVRDNRLHAADGTYSIDLNGERSDTYALAQTFDTIAGQIYQVSFDLSGNPDGPPLQKSLKVSAADTSVTYSFPTTLGTRPNLFWLPQGFAFVATGTSTTLRFDSLTAGDYGPMLDNVRVAAVPEPSLVTLVAAGSGLLWIIQRRRRRPAL